MTKDAMTKEGVSDTTLSTRSSRIPDRKIREMPAKKVSRVIDVQKNNQLKYSFTGVPDIDPRACFNQSTLSPALNTQQPPLGTSHLILGDSLVRVLQNLRTSWITAVMAFGGAFGGAMRMLNGARLSVNGLYSITGVDWLIAAVINFSSTTTLRFADLEGLPSNNTMGPVNARPLQDVKLNHDEGNRGERHGRFLTTRAPFGQHVKMFRQLKAPPGHVKERVYPKQVNQEGDVQRYGGLKAIKKDETIFAAYDKSEMRKAKIMIVSNSDFVYTSKSLYWPDVIMLAAVDLDLMQSILMVIGVQRQSEMNPITIVFAGINDHLHSRGFLSRLREPTTAEAAV